MIAQSNEALYSEIIEKNGSTVILINNAQKLRSSLFYTNPREPRKGFWKYTQIQMVIYSPRNEESLQTKAHEGRILK